MRELILSVPNNTRIQNVEIQRTSVGVLKDALNRFGHTKSNCIHCFGDCNIYMPVLNTFGPSIASTQTRACALHTLLSYSNFISDIDQLTSIDTIVSDVPGDGNCWIYAFVVSIKKNYGISMEPQYVRDKLCTFIQKMEALNHRLDHPTAFHTIHNSLHMDSIYHILKFLSEKFTNGRVYEACSLIVKNGTPYYCSWAGTIGIELNLLCTVFNSIIIVFTNNRTSSFSFLTHSTGLNSFISIEDLFPRTSSEVSPMGRKIARFGNCASLGTSGCIENIESLFIKCMFYPCGMERTVHNIRRCKLSFLKHHNENHYQPVFLKNQASLSSVFLFLDSIK